MTRVVWKSIPNYEGLYEVSSLGRVRSLNRTIVDTRDRRRTLKGKILNPSKNLDGRLQVWLCSEGKQILCLVHRLVLLTFIGKPPKDKEAAHNNGDPSDNRLVNLRYVTRVENQHDSIKHGTSNAKLTEQDIITIRKRVKNCTQTALAKEYNVNPTTINHVVKRRTWQHI